MFSCFHGCVVAHIFGIFSRLNFLSNLGQILEISKATFGCFLEEYLESAVETPFLENF